LRFPDEFAVYWVHATLAEHFFHWNDAAARFAGLIARFPNDFPSRYRYAAVLRHCGCRNEAERVLVEEIETFPSEPRALVELGRLLGTMQISERSVSTASLNQFIEAGVG